MWRLCYGEDGGGDVVSVGGDGDVGGVGWRLWRSGDDGVRLRWPTVEVVLCAKLIITPIDFSAYVMNHLKIDNLTQEHLVGLAFKLLKGTCKSRVELEYNIKEYYKVVTDRLDWNNPEGKEYPFNLSKPLLLIMERGRQVVPVNYFLNNDLDYPRERSSSKKYTNSITKTKVAKYDIPGIEDMHYGCLPDVLSFLRVGGLQLGVKSYQKKLNITKPETFRSDISNRTPYTAYNNPQGIIYEDKYKRNRMDYLPKRRWSSLDRKRSRIMIKAIDKQQLERRLMRSLEKFVGGRDYREDLRLLRRTI
ncbi:hypothetical protein Tco_1265594 [Tanacetum coccineum]